MITDEQWIAALAAHWSPTPSGKRYRIGQHIVAAGFLAPETIEAEARAFHDDLDVVEVEDHRPRSERSTLPVPTVSFVERPL